MTSTKFENDEIDLRELFISLWRGKWFIIFCVLVAIALASVYLRNSDRLYTVTYIFQPVSNDDKAPKFAGFGGIASLAGITLPTSSSSDFSKYKFLIKSEEVAASLLKDESLVKQMFKSEWNENSNSFEKPQLNMLGNFKKSLKTLLSGTEELEYLPPNAARLSVWFQTTINISTDRETGFLTLSSESSSPNLIESIMINTSKITDNLLKERYIANAEEMMLFYQTQLSKARAREHREALAKLIAQEDQKLMLASKGDYFVAEPLTAPSVSLYPTSPKSTLILALAIVLGAFIGSALVLLRKAMRA
jgi:LPS O-antigen subunit length determinant protein (WzzB/FepE family)